MSKHILFIFLILSTTLINLTKCDDTSVKEVKEETELVDTNDGETISNYDHDYDFLMEEDPTSDPEVDHELKEGLYDSELQDPEHFLKSRDIKKAILDKHLTDENKTWATNELVPFIVEFIYHYTEQDIENAEKEYQLKGKKSDPRNLEMLHDRMLVKAYLEKRFEKLGKKEITKAEALKLMSHQKYDKFMYQIPDDVLYGLDDYVADDDTSGDM